MWILLLALLGFLPKAKTTNEELEQVLEEKCKDKYSTTCAKLELINLLAQYGNETRVNVLPGVTVLGTQRTGRLADELLKDVGYQKRADLTTFIVDSFTKYLGTLNVTVQLQESHVVPVMRSIGENVWTGRGRRYGWYAVGTVAAVGFSLLAALSSKALMASMLALMLSGMMALRGGGAGGGGGGGGGGGTAMGAVGGRITQYEIISKPAALSTGPAHYYDHEHHHSTYSVPYASYTSRAIQGDQEKTN